MGIRFLYKIITVLLIIFFCNTTILAAENLWVYYNDGSNWIGNTLVVKDDLQLYGDFTIPDGKTIKIYNGFTINIPADYMLTINGAIEAGSYQIFIDEHPYTNPGIAGNPKVKYINAYWWGLGTGSGEDEYKKLQRSIDLAANLADDIPGGLVLVPYHNTGIELENSVTIKRSVILDGQWNNFVMTENNDVFHVDNSAQLRNVRITQAEITPAYTKNYVTLKPTSNMKGNNSGLWLSGLKAEFKNDTGNAVVLDGSTYYIQGASAQNIECYNGNICILSKAGGVYGEQSTPTWSNGNSIINVVAHHCEYAIYEQDTDVVGGNVYSNIFTQPNIDNPTGQRAKIYLNESSVITGGNLRNLTPIVFKKGQNIIVASGSANTSLTDEGQNNRVILSGAHYFNGNWIQGGPDSNTSDACEDFIKAGLGLPADLSGDCKVNLKDLSLLAVQWFDSVYSVSWNDYFSDGSLDQNYIVHQNPVGGICTATETSDYVVEVFTNSPGGSLAQQAIEIQLGDTVRTYFEQTSAWNNYSISAIGITYDLSADRYLDKSVATFFLQNWRDSVLAYRHVGIEEALTEITNVGDPLGNTWVYEMVIGENNGNGTFDVNLSVYDLDGTKLGDSVTMTTSTPTGNMYWFCGDNRTLDRVYKLEIGKVLGPITLQDSCEQIIQSGSGLNADISKNCTIDFGDLLLLAEFWLDCTVPRDPDCIE